MTTRKAAAVILAAGQGTRMKSRLPKSLHPLAGRPMVSHIIATLEGLGTDRVVVVVGPDGAAVTEAVAPLPTAIQARPLGTADAVMAARDALAGYEGDVMVLYGDTPLIPAETLARVLDRRHARPGPAIVVLGFEPEDPGAYGRLVTGSDGALLEIVEAREADADQIRIGLCNSGVMAIDGKVLFGLLDAVGNDNAKGEFYLTDIVAIARARGLDCAYVAAPAEELLGVNSRAELAVAERVVQTRLRAAAMADGATLVDPETVWLSHDTRLGRDVWVEPNVVFGPGVEIGDDVEIRAFSHIAGARVSDGAVIGPFARLRPGAEIGPDARIGNYVEVKAARIEAGAKANHLSYIGDAVIGASANIGAGTITCNYDGFTKSMTDVGAGAFIGSNTALVAPVKVGAGAIVAAGSTITRDVAADALGIERSKQEAHPEWAKRFRARKTAAKAGKVGKRAKKKTREAG